MYLHLLEITYAVEDRATIETWLSQAYLGGAIISTEQYSDEILAVLASEQVLGETYQELQRHPAISSCEKKRRAVYRVTTITEPKHALCAFPFREGEEWYVGSGKMIYLCVLSHRLSEQQAAWLATNTHISEWKYLFDLISVLA
jgi:hypothetical protein